MKTTTTTTTTNAVNALFERVESAVNAGTLDESVLYDFARYVVCSVVKKHYQQTADAVSARRTRSALGSLDSLRLAVSNLNDLLDTFTNKDGEMYTDYRPEHKRPVYSYESGHKVLKGYIVKDSARELYKSQDGVRISYSFDLLHDAIVALYDVVEKSPSPFNLTRPYIVHELDKHVYIRSDDSKAVKEVETTPVREIFRAVRRNMKDSHSCKVETPYSYEQLKVDELSGLGDGLNWRDEDSRKYYVRLEKYADLGGYARDFNGKPTEYTVDSQTIADTETLVESLKLSKRESEVLALMRRGYGYKAIGTYLGMKPGSVQKNVQRIRAKAEREGLTLERYNAMSKRPETSPALGCAPAGVLKPYPVHTFESLGLTAPGLRSARYPLPSTAPTVKAGEVIETREYYLDD